jgi:hypothetical protein
MAKVADFAVHATAVPLTAEAIATVQGSVDPANYYNEPDTFTLRDLDEQSARAFLNEKAWPEGIQKFLVKSVVQMPYRFFICDDSGSMASNDGSRIIGENANTKVVPCTRWSELVESLKFHATLAKSLNAPTEFRFLNSATPMIIGGNNDNYDRLMELFEGSPGGQTPLCKHIRIVVEKIREMEASLREARQKVAVIIATDGEASDGDVIQALRPLCELPVWVVIRLCTNEENVVNYWSGIDSQLELEMDVIDDLIGESREIWKVNPWLNYGEPLQRLREFGVHLRELDLIDESKISGEQMRVVCSIILNVSPSQLPHPGAELDAFIRQVALLEQQLPQVWSPSLRQLRRWIEIPMVKKCYGPKKGCVVS